jgi:DNA repair exonuclease SbcCD ATPase subunit
LLEAPQTKSSQLIKMAEELKEIVEIKDMKLDAIKQFTKEVREELEEDFETKRHEKEYSEKIKEVFAKNNDLATKTENIIRLNDKLVLWLDKTYPNIKELDKLSVEEKAKYDILTKELADKKKELDALEAKVTSVSKIANKIRFVIMKHSTSVMSNVTEDRLDMILEQYDEANGILDDIAGGIKSVVSSVIEWFKNIFK